jgi:hypothetical protein
MISTLLGLLVQPFLRAYYPYRNEIKAVIKHVENHRSFSYWNKKDSGFENDELENTLYEFLYRTIEHSLFFTSKVNE